MAGVSRRVLVVVALVAVFVVPVGAGVAAPVGAAGSSFPDVPEGHLFFDDVEWLAGEGVTTGYSDGSFGPGRGVTRQEMAAFMFRFANKAATDTATCEVAPFTDVASGDVFCGYVDWLASAGVTTGRPDGSFGATGPVLRQEMAAFLYRFTHPGGQSPPSCVGVEFTDVAASSPFCGYISWLAGEGITVGDGEGGFDPGAVVSRQAMASFLHRLDGYGPGPNELAPETEIIDEAETTFETLDPEGTSTLTYTGTKPVAAGDVVVTTTASGPFYGRVSSVDGNEIVTAPATLMDVVPELDLSLSVDAETGAADVGAPAGGLPVVVETPELPAGAGLDAPTAASGQCSGSAGGTVTADVDVDAGRFELNADWHWLRGPELLEVLYTPTFTTAVHAGLEAAGTCTYHADLFDVDLPTIKFSIGPVPVWITHDIAADFDASVEIAGEASVDAGFTAQGRLGARYEGGNFDFVNEFSVDRDLDTTVKATATARVDVPVTYGARAYGVLGFDAAAGPFAELNVDPLDTPWLTLDAGLQGSVAAVFDLSAGPINFYKSHTFGPWEFARWRIYDTGTDNAWPGPRISSTLPAASVGEPYSARLSAEGGTTPYTWAAIEPMPDGLSLDGDGRITGTPTEVPSDPLTIAVTDAAGYSDQVLVAFSSAPPVCITENPGTWTGTWQDGSVNGSVSADLSFGPDGALTGDYDVAGSEIAFGGTLEGTVSCSTIDFGSTSEGLRFTGFTETGTTVFGTFSGLASGTFEISYVAP